MNTHDHLPEITEDFTMTVKRADGSETVIDSEKKPDKTRLHMRIYEMAKEVLHGRWRADQT